MKYKIKILLLINLVFCSSFLIAEVKNTKLSSTPQRRIASVSRAESLSLHAFAGLENSSYSLGMSAGVGIGAFTPLTYLSNRIKLEVGGNFIYLTNRGYNFLKSDSVSKVEILALTKVRYFITKHFSVTSEVGIGWVKLFLSDYYELDFNVSGVKLSGLVIPVGAGALYQFTPQIAVFAGPRILLANTSNVQVLFGAFFNFR